MCNDVVDPPVVALLYRLLAAEEEAERRVLLLRSCRFRTPPPPERDECVDSEAFEAAVTAAATAGTGVAAATPDVGDAPPPLDLPCPLFRHFGPHGEAVVLEYLRSASPKSLVKLFGGGGEAEAQQEGAAFAKLCGVAMRSWRLAACRLEEVADVLTVVGWFPEARSRCAPLVWGAGDDSGRFEALTVESQVEQHTAQVRQVLGIIQPAPMPTSVDSVTYEGLLARRLDAREAAWSPLSTASVWHVRRRRSTHSTRSKAPRQDCWAAARPTRGAPARTHSTSRCTPSFRPAPTTDTQAWRARLGSELGRCRHGNRLPRTCLVTWNMERWGTR